MAEITLTIPDDKVSEILTAFDSVYPGRGEMTKAAWAKKKTIDFVRSTVSEHRQREARKLSSSEVINIT